MATTRTDCVCVWVDKTGDPTDPRWIVSRDRLDDRGQAETTHTLDVLDTEDEAIEEGQRQARRLGLPLCRNPEDGPAALLQAAAIYLVETYGGDGSWADPQVARHDTLDAALEDVADRLGCDAGEIDPDGDWTPDADMHGDDIPDGARPVGAWNESDTEGCGGVALWKVED